MVALKKAAELLAAGYEDKELETRCLNLAEDIRDGIEAYGVVDHPKYGKIYAYETDGFGNYNLMDDANSPSLLAIPYLGYKPADDPIYQNTRRFILSEDNPYYFVGKVAKGIGSPHTPHRYIWHIGLTMQILTTLDPAEKQGVPGKPSPGPMPAPTSCTKASTWTIPPSLPVLGLPGQTPSSPRCWSRRLPMWNDPEELRDRMKSGKLYNTADPQLPGPTEAVQRAGL